MIEDLQKEFPLFAGFSIPILVWVLVELTFRWSALRKRSAFNIWNKIKFPVGFLLLLLSVYLTAKLKFEDHDALWDDAFRLLLIFFATWFVIAVVHIVAKSTIQLI